MRCFICNKPCNGAASICDPCAQEKAKTKRGDSIWSRNSVTIKGGVKTVVRNDAMATAFRKALGS